MKKFFLLLASVLMIGTFAVSCGPEEKPEDPKKEDPKPQPEPEKSHAALLTAFSVSSGDVTIEGQVFAEDKYVALSFDEILFNCTAKVTVSDKAVVSPDPASITDWTGTHTLTVVAEDGETSNAYTIKAEDPIYKTVLSVNSEKVATAIPAQEQAYYGGNLIAFCSPTLIADGEGNVFDLSLTKVGNLNMTGVEPGEIESLANDEEGVLIATVGYGDADKTIAPDDHVNGVVSIKMFAWKDGYDQAPTMIYDNGSNAGMYLNVEGKLSGEMHAFALTDARTGDHHTWSFHNGSRPIGDEWRFFNTKMLDNRADDSGINDNSQEYFYASALNKGLSSGQNVHAIDMDNTGENGKPNGGIYVFASSAPEWDGTNQFGWRTPADNTTFGWIRPAGALVFVRDGIDGTDIAMPGTALTLVENPLKHGGAMGYGNTDMPTGIKIFRFDGTLYAAIAHCGVVDIYFTVQNVDYYLGKEENVDKQYLQKTIRGLEAARTNMKPSLAYCYDPETGDGHIAVSYLKVLGDSSDAAYRTYTVKREIVK